MLISASIFFFLHGDVEPFSFFFFFRKREVCSRWKIRNNPCVIRFSQFPFYVNFLVQQWHLRIVRKNEITWQQPGLVTLITSMTRALTFPDSAFYISLIFNFVPRLMKPSVKIRSPRFRRFDSRDTFNTIKPRVPGILRIFIQHRCEQFSENLMNRLVRFCTGNLLWHVQVKYF